MGWQDYKLTWVGGKRRYLHRVLMERQLGRPLLQSEVVRFRDGDRGNCVIENLEMVSREQHGAMNGGRSKAKHKTPAWNRTEQDKLDCVIPLFKVKKSYEQVARILGMQGQTVRSHIKKNAPQLLSRSSKSA